MPLWALPRIREALAELEAHARTEGLIELELPRLWTVLELDGHGTMATCSICWL